jgi:4-hydroxy-2-oxoglutarate aldolase
MNLAGVFVAAVTPFDPVTGEIDLVGMRTNVRAWMEHPVLGVVVGGSTGEAVYLDDEERRKLLDGVRPLVTGDRLMIAGVGAESTRTTLRHCHAAADAGAAAVLVKPPAFYKGAMTPEALALHYRQIADQSSLPVIIYQVPPKLSTIDLPTGLVAELSRHENIIGIKDSRAAIELIGDLVEQCKPGFQVLVGSGSTLYASLEIGAVGGVLGVGNLMPGETAELVAAHQEGRGQAAGRLQEHVGPVHKVVVGDMGVPGIKAAMDLIGLQGGNPRPPMLPLAEKRRAELRQVLENAGLLRERAQEAVRG